MKRTVREYERDEHGDVIKETVTETDSFHDGRAPAPVSVEAKVDGIAILKALQDLKAKGWILNLH